MVERSNREDDDLRSQRSVKVVRQCDVGVITDTAQTRLFFCKERRRDQNTKKKTNLFRVSEIQKKKKEREREREREACRKRDTFKSRCAVLFQHIIRIITTYKYASSSRPKRVKKPRVLLFERAALFFFFDDDAQYADDDDDDDDERVVAFSSIRAFVAAASTQKNETTFLNTPLSNGFLNVPSAARR